MSLTGTIYITNTNMTSTNYQKLQVQGNAGSSTFVKGEIITSTLLMGGGGTIVMQLDPNSVVSVDQVALVK